MVSSSISSRISVPNEILIVGEERKKERKKQTNKQIKEGRRSVRG